MLATVTPEARCGLCGHPRIEGDPWQTDHIIPASRGGASTRDNLQIVHASCNRRRGSKLGAELLDHAERLESTTWGTRPTGFIRQAARRLVEPSPQDVNAEAEAARQVTRSSRGAARERPGSTGSSRPALIHRASRRGIGSQVAVLAAGVLGRGVVWADPFD